jgi:hypothetical protein
MIKIPPSNSIADLSENLTDRKDSSSFDGKAVKTTEKIIQTDDLANNSDQFDKSDQKANQVDFFS